MPTVDFTAYDAATSGQRLDILARLVEHPQATFVMRASGNSMREAGIFDGDLLVVDRAVPHRHGQIVVAVVDGEMVCKTLWQRGGRQRLKAAQPGFPDLIPREGQSVEVWGVVRAVVKFPLV